MAPNAIHDTRIWCDTMPKAVVKQMGVEGGGSRNAKSGSNEWIWVGRGAANQGGPLETLGKSRRFVGLAWYEPLSVGTLIVIVDTVKQISAAGWRGISIKKWFHGVALSESDTAK